MTKLNRETASKKAAKYYLENPDKCSKLLPELEYPKIAKKVINGTANSLEKLIIFIDGFNWEAFKLDELDEQAQSTLKIMES